MLSLYELAILVGCRLPSAGVVQGAVDTRTKPSTRTVPSRPEISSDSLVAITSDCRVSFSERKEVERTTDIHTYRFSTSKPQSMVARHPLANWSVATTANGVPLSSRFPCAVTELGSSLTIAVSRIFTHKIPTSEANRSANKWINDATEVGQNQKRACVWLPVHGDQNSANGVPVRTSHSVPTTITKTRRRSNEIFCRSRTNQGHPGYRVDQRQSLGCCLQKILPGGGLGSKTTH